MVILHKLDILLTELKSTRPSLECQRDIELDLSKLAKAKLKQHNIE